MRKIIHNLRQQPEKVRRHILHVTTLVFGFLLLVLWVYSLGTNLSSEEVQVKVDNNLKPLSVLKDNLVNGYNSLQAETLEVSE